MHTKGKWENNDGDIVVKVQDNWPLIAIVQYVKTMAETRANARLIAAAPDLLVVSHNLSETMGIDYAIKKLSTLSDDTMALGAATILKGIQRQAKEAIKKAEGK